MFLSIRHKPMRKEALMHKVVNLDTGEDIPRVIWANDSTGRYRQFIVGKNGGLIVDTEKGRAKSKIFSGNIKLVKVKPK